MKRRTALAIATLLTVLLLAAGARLYVGSAGFGFPTGDLAHHIFAAREQRLWVGALVGASLAVSGVALQALLRNPLAEPFILGLSTGAGAGVMAQSAISYALWRQYGSGSLGALLGAALSMTIVYLAGRRRGILDPLGLLLTGVVLSTINGALILLFNYLVGPGGLRDNITHWMMGYLSDTTDPMIVRGVGLLLLLGFVLLLTRARAMDIATLSEPEAVSLGVPIARLRALLFVIASALTAGAVVLSGPIAFVGLICPHAARLMLGPAHGPLLVGAALAGAALVVLAVALAAALALRYHIGVMPIGVFTAILAGPVFLWMLRPHLGRGME